MNRWTLGMAAAAVAFAGTAIAQQQTPTPAEPRGWARMLDKLDANRDGQISIEEATATAKARFAKADANGDGKISEQEAMAMRQQRRDRMLALRGGPNGGPNGGPGGWRGGGRGRGGPGMMLARLDTDHDGTLTRAEYDAPFDRFDTNRDGAVDTTEIQAARQMMRQLRDAPAGNTK